MALTLDQIDPNANYQCCVAFASQVGDAMEGQLFKGRDPRVQTVPQYFVRHGDPTAERPTVWDVAVEQTSRNAHAIEEEKRRLFEEAAKANPVKLEAPKPVAIVTAKRDVMAAVDGVPTMIRKGSKLQADHPIAVEFEADFS